MSHSEEEQPNREVTMRIMCLHGFGSDSEALYENQLRDLDERLFQRHGIELVYVNSPLACDPSDIVLQQLEPNNLLLDKETNDSAGDEVQHALASRSEGAATTKSNNASTAIISPLDPSKRAAASRTNYRPTKEHRSRRKWFDDPQQAVETSQETPQQYVGLDASILHVRQVWQQALRSSPFTGVLGFGQGASLAALLPLLPGPDPNNPTLMFEGLDFILCMGGLELLPSPKQMDNSFNPSYWHTTDQQLDEYRYDGEGSDVAPKSLFVYAASSTKNKMSSKASAKLAQRYGPNAQIHNYQGIDNFDERGNQRVYCLKAKDSNVVGKFLVQQKKNLVQKLGGTLEARQLMETQTELARLEVKASNALATSIALNPPKALMAVIAPNAVGGWTGPKLRDPTDGGGAPHPDITTTEGASHTDTFTTDTANSHHFRDATRNHPKATI